MGFFKDIFKKEGKTENPFEGLRELALKVNGDENGFHNLEDDDPYKALVRTMGTFRLAHWKSVSISSINGF